MANRLVKTHGKLRSLQYSIAFLKAAISQRIVPVWIHAQIEKSRARHTPTIERAFMLDEIAKKRSLIFVRKKNYVKLWSHIRMFLSFFDIVRFGRYLATINTTKDKEHQWKNNRNLSLLRLQRFGNTANPDKKNITNVSDYKLSSTEEFVLSHRLNFFLPPTHLMREKIFAEFEVLFAQLQHH